VQLLKSFDLPAAVGISIFEIKEYTPLKDKSGTLNEYSLH